MLPGPAGLNEVEWPVGACSCEREQRQPTNPIGRALGSSGAAPGTRSEGGCTCSARDTRTPDVWWSRCWKRCWSVTTGRRRSGRSVRPREVQALTACASRSCPTCCGRTGRGAHTSTWKARISRVCLNGWRYPKQAARRNASWGCRVSMSASSSQHCSKSGSGDGRPTFAESRDGLRPGRHALKRSPKPKPLGLTAAAAWGLLMSEKCFDQVCHARLRSRLAQRRAEKRVLKIRASLHAGMLDNGLSTVPEAGPPQGSPLHRACLLGSRRHWRRSWSAAGTEAAARPLIAISTCGVGEPGHGSWPVSGGSLPTA